MRNKRLIIAKVCRNPLVFERLVEQGLVDVKNDENRGVTALMYAIMGGKPDLCKWLIEEKGADVNAKDNDGKTAADYARGNDEIIRLMKKD